MTQTTEELQMLSFTIILHAGNARSLAMEAIAHAKQYEFEAARKKINEADAEFAAAHDVQTKLLQDKANGHQNAISVILIHAQDHLMTAMTVKDLANEMVDMYEKMQQLEGE